MPLDLLAPLDNRDDRREIWFLLQHLTDAERLDFLLWCRDQTNERIKLRHNPPWTFVTVLDTTCGHLAETFTDLALMCSEFELDQSVVLRELERRASLKRLSIGL
jgi:hypothetical protein